MAFWMTIERSDGSKKRARIVMRGMYQDSIKSGKKLEKVLRETFARLYPTSKVTSLLEMAALIGIIANIKWQD